MPQTLPSQPKARTSGSAWLPPRTSTPSSNNSPPTASPSVDRLGVPREYAAAVRGHRDALAVLRASNRLWTYFSSAEDIGPGERTGRFRIGGDQAVLDVSGRSRILVEDAAIALIDEAELQDTGARSGFHPAAGEVAWPNAGTPRPSRPGAAGRSGRGCAMRRVPGRCRLRSRRPGRARPGSRERPAGAPGRREANGLPGMPRRGRRQQLGVLACGVLA